MSSEKKKQHSSSTEKIKILLAEDYSLTAEMEKQALEKEGFEVRCSTTKDDMIDAVRNDYIDIVLIDFQFGRGRGIEAIPRARELSCSHTTKFVVSSVLHFQNVQERARSVRADKFLIKPMPREEFVRELKQLLSKKARNETRIYQEFESFIHFKDQIYKTKSINLSFNGAFILNYEKQIPLTAGDCINLNLFLPRHKTAIKIHGKVIHMLEEGFGLRFEEISRIDKKKIEEFVKEKIFNSSVYYM